MSEKNDFKVELETILARLNTLERTLNNSINHTEGSNLTYPIASKEYNQILNRLKELSQSNSDLKMMVDNLVNFEERNFLASGNYNYAVDLQTTIRILHSNLLSLELNSGEEKNRQSVVPIVFISYATEEVALADFVKEILLRWTNNKISVFIAKRDLKSSHAWVGIMEDTLKKAPAIISICSKDVKNNPSWVLWETAAVWGAKHKVHPLFTNISPKEFGDPLVLFVQGKHYFDKDEFIDVLLNVCQQLNVEVKASEFSKEESDKFNKLSEEHKKKEDLRHHEAKFGSIFKTPNPEIEAMKIIESESESFIEHISEVINEAKDETYESLWDCFIKMFQYSYDYLLLAEQIIKYDNNHWEAVTKIFERICYLNKSGDRYGKNGLVNYFFYCMLEIFGAMTVESSKFVLLRTMLEINRLKRNNNGIEDILHWNIIADFIEIKNQEEAKQKGSRWIVPRFHYLLEMVETLNFPLKFDIKMRLKETDLLYFVYSVKNLEGNSFVNPWFPCSPVYSSYGAPPLFKKIKYDEKFGAIIANQLFNYDYVELLELIKKAKEIIHGRFKSVYFDSDGAEEVLDDF